LALAWVIMRWSYSNCIVSLELLILGASLERKLDSGEGRAVVALENVKLRIALGGAPLTSRVILNSSV
jgi:hypothetical protein